MEAESIFAYSSEEKDLGVVISFGILFALVFLLCGLLRGFSPGVWAFLGIVGALYMLKLKEERKSKNMLAFTIAYTALSAVLYLFVYLESTAPTLFWIIVVAVIILLLIVAVFLAVWLGSTDKPDN